MCLPCAGFMLLMMVLFIEDKWQVSTSSSNNIVGVGDPSIETNQHSFNRNLPTGCSEDTLVFLNSDFKNKTIISSMNPHTEGLGLIHVNLASWFAFMSDASWLASILKCRLPSCKKLDLQKAQFAFTSKAYVYDGWHGRSPKFKVAQCEMGLWVMKRRQKITCVSVVANCSFLEI